MDYTTLSTKELHNHLHAITTVLVERKEDEHEDSEQEEVENDQPRWLRVCDTEGCDCRFYTDDHDELPANVVTTALYVRCNDTDVKTLENDIGNDVSYISIKTNNRGVYYINCSTHQDAALIQAKLQSENKHYSVNFLVKKKTEKKAEPLSMSACFKPGCTCKYYFRSDEERERGEEAGFNQSRLYLASRHFKGKKEAAVFGIIKEKAGPTPKGPLVLGPGNKYAFITYKNHADAAMAQSQLTAQGFFANFCTVSAPRA